MPRGTSADAVRSPASRKCTYKASSGLCKTEAGGGLYEGGISMGQWAVLKSRRLRRLRRLYLEFRGIGGIIRN